MMNIMQQMQMVQKLMKDENFRAFIAHPKTQQFLQDPEFIELMKKQDFDTALKNPRLAALRDDPELLELLKKVRLPS